jgi:hypothetical protein
MYKKIIITLLTVLIIGANTSCVKTDINKNPKAYLSTNAEYLYSNAQKNLFDVMSSANVNRNVFRLFSQQWTQTTYIDESRYIITNRSVPDNFWLTLYRDVIKQCFEAKKIVNADLKITDALAKKEKIATIDVLEQYAYYVLTTTFGDIPYTKAMDIENPQPTYDKSADVLEGIINNLNNDIIDLNAGTGNSFDAADLVYAGSSDMWVKFANSLKVKIGMLYKDSDPSKAKSIVEAAYSNAFTSASDNAKFNYLSTFPNTNPIWEDLVQSGRHDFVVTQTLLNNMDSTTLGAGNLDPRLPMFANFSADTTIYVGGEYGAPNSDGGDVSFPGDMVTVETFPGILISYSEIQFLLAEAAEAGMSVGMTDEQLYNSAVKESMKEWGVSSTDADSYLTLAAVNYASATGTKKQKLATQNWLSLYNRGFEAWTQWRRLDYPILTPPPTLTAADIPTRYNYPVSEQNLNTASYSAASSNIGGDKKTTKLFWDKF